MNYERFSRTDSKKFNEIHTTTRFKYNKLIAAGILQQFFILVLNHILQLFYFIKFCSIIFLLLLLSFKTLYFSPGIFAVSSVALFCRYKIINKILFFFALYRYSIHSNVSPQYICEVSLYF